MHLSRTVAPAERAVSLTTAKSHLRIDGTSEDDLIGAYLDAAIRTAERHSDLSFVSSTFLLTLECFPRNGTGRRAEDIYGEIKLPIGPVTSVTSLQYRDVDETWQTIDTDDYWVGAKRGVIWPAINWPGESYGPESVRVTFVAGWADAASVPADAKAAILLILGDLYENRGDGVDSPERDMPPAAKRLLWSLRSEQY